MGKRERRRQREAELEALRQAYAPRGRPGEAARDSGLLAGQIQPEMREKLQRIAEGLRARRRGLPGEVAALTRHADHDPALSCRPALGDGLCYPAPAGAHLVPWREVPGQQER